MSLEVRGAGEPSGAPEVARGILDADAPDRPSLSEAELHDLLGPARVLWRSPRPLSAAAVVERDGHRLFVKRHHSDVRTPQGLAEEHAFLRHLREHGAPVAEVLGALARGEWVYEVHAAGTGTDLSRDALSWSPFGSEKHARAAGAALAQLHLAAEGFDAPRRRPQHLVASFTVFAAVDPEASLEAYLRHRPDLARALAHRPWRQDLREVHLPFYEELLPYLVRLEPLWTHNDWHASNLLWDEPSGTVSTVLDFGLSDRTTAVHDLATAIQRNTVHWPDPARPVRLDDLDALLEGYQEQRPLSAAESAALPALLPLVHAESTLSEMGYFHGVTGSAADTALAYDRFVGHTRWFDGEDGTRLLNRIRTRL
ncbi:phosphotransferase enzyme family protein [Streptomyces avermitilis]